MNKQNIIEMLELHLVQLTHTANSKNAEMQQKLADKITETKQFLRQLTEAEQMLALQLAESEQWLNQLQQPLNFADELNEIKALDETDIAKMQHQLADKVHQKITECKAETLANEQTLTDKMVEIRQQLSGKTPLLTALQHRVNARFGKQIQWLKMKTAEQLIFCADKLKA